MIIITLFCNCVANDNNFKDLCDESKFLFFLLYKIIDYLKLFIIAF